MDRRGADGRLPEPLPPAHPAVVRPDPVHGDAQATLGDHVDGVDGPWNAGADDDGHAEGRPLVKVGPLSSGGDGFTVSRP